MTPEERRRQFFDFFRRRADAIAALQLAPAFRADVDFESLRTTLVCAQLEALAKARYANRQEWGQNTRRSGHRFRRLLENHSGDRGIYRLVALDRLHTALQHRGQDARGRAARVEGDARAGPLTEAEDYERAAGIVERLLAQRGFSEARDGSRIVDGSDLDLLVDGVEQALREHGLNPVPKLVAHAVLEKKYSAIVWEDYRCALVHEARIKHQGFDLAEDRPPYYFSELEDSGEVTYPLVIPAKFLLRTLPQTIDCVEAFCALHGVDPYACFGIP